LQPKPAQAAHLADLARSTHATKSADFVKQIASHIGQKDRQDFTGSPSCLKRVGRLDCRVIGSVLASLCQI
jgi:hypothetical protein